METRACWYSSAEFLCWLRNQSLHGGITLHVVITRLWENEVQTSRLFCTAPVWVAIFGFIANSQRTRRTAKGCTVDKASPRNIPERTEIWGCEPGIESPAWVSAFRMGTSKRSAHFLLNLQKFLSSISYFGRTKCTLVDQNNTSVPVCSRQPIKFMRIHTK